ncbi:MAG: rod shape-determining protein [Lachnospiraceae bacterium]
MSSHAYGLDIGTDYFRMCSMNRILDERCCIALENKTDVRAVGDEAFEMAGKAPVSIRVSFPVKNGVIAGLADMQQLLTQMYRRINDGKRVNGASFYIAVPTDISGVERRAFTDVIFRAGLREKNVSVVDMPIACAIGAGIDVFSRDPSMVVNIGGSRTSVSVISEGGIAAFTSIPVGGDLLDENIVQTVRRNYNILIGRRTAENLKKQIGSALPGSSQVSVSAFGRSVLSGLPGRCTVTADVISASFEKEMEQIAAAITSTLEKTPSVTADYVRSCGFYLTGGTALMRNLRPFLTKQTGIPCAVVQNPSEAAIRGIIAIIGDKRKAALARRPESELY